MIKQNFNNDIKETTYMPKQKKNNYMISVVAAFVVALVAASFMFQGDTTTNAIRYLSYLVFIVAVLSFTLFLVKMLFHSQAKTENDEFNLSEIPKNQEDVRKSH